MIADLKDRELNTVTLFIIINFCHHKHLHLPKDHVVAFTEKDCNEGEVLEICTMEQLEKDLPRNWIQERKCQEKLSEFFENLFMQKEDDFLKSSAEALVHRKVLLEDKNISPKTQQAFDELCQKYDDIISKNSGDIGKTMLVEMEIDTGNHPPIASKPYTLPLKHYEWIQREIESLERAGIIERSISPWASPVVIVPKKSTSGETPQKENVHGLPENQQATSRGHQSRQWKRVHITHTTPQNRRTLCQTQRIQSILESRPQVRILPHRTIRISKAKISISSIISRQIPIQQSFIWTHSSTSILPETNKRHVKRMQLCNGLLR